MYRFYFNSHRWKPTYDQWIYANRCIPIDEIQRIDEYVFQRDVKFALIGQLLIRYLLNRVFQKNSSSFVIQRTKFHRPFIQSNPSFDFNLSHRNQFVCIAGIFNGQIGCDTMDCQTKPINKRLLRKKFTINENKLIEQNPLNFSRLWCLKESYVKYLGIGIGYPLLKLNFHFQTKDFNQNLIISDTKLDIDDNNNQLIRFDEQIINHNQQQIITLCLPINSPCQSFVELNIDDILHGCTPFDENKNIHLISWQRFQMKRLITKDL
jgi:4'-phosphopantetheinyl transferase